MKLTTNCHAVSKKKTVLCIIFDSEAELEYLLPIFGDSVEEYSLVSFFVIIGVISSWCDLKSQCLKKISISPPVSRDDESSILSYVQETRKRGKFLYSMNAKPQSEEMKAFFGGIGFSLLNPGLEFNSSFVRHTIPATMATSPVLYHAEQLDLRFRLVGTWWGVSGIAVHESEGAGWYTSEKLSSILASGSDDMKFVTKRCEDVLKRVEHNMTSPLFSADIECVRGAAKTVVFHTQLFELHDIGIHRVIGTGPLIRKDFWTYLSLLSTPELRTGKLKALSIKQLKKHVNTCSHELINHIVGRRYKYMNNLHLAVSDRIGALRTLLDTLPGSIDPESECIVIASSGRERIFGGHTDFPGNGGSTVNCASNLEHYALFVVVPSDSSDYPGYTLCMTNSDSKKFPSDVIYLSKLERMASNGSVQSGRVLWSEEHWANYVRGALLHALSKDRFAKSEDFSKALRENLSECVVHAHVSSTGRYALPSSGGLSSSGALTGSVVMALAEILGLEFSIEEAASCDYGEYFLGKRAGSADKAAVLHASPFHLSYIGSCPDRLLKTASLPHDLRVFMAESPIPRLTTSEGKSYLIQEYGVEEAERIYEWAKSRMSIFCSKAYEYALDYARRALSEIKSEDNSSFSLIREILREGLFRDLVSLSIQDTAKLLRLFPEYKEKQAGNREDFDMRGVVAYAVGENSRVAEYVSLIEEISASHDEEHRKIMLARIIYLSKLAQDGDRAFFDHRKWKPSEWSLEYNRNPSYLLSDEYLDDLASSSTERGTQSGIIGAFQRSIVEIDEDCTDLWIYFNGAASGRISAAGMGGSICVHCTDVASAEVRSWLSSRGYSVREVEAGGAPQILF